MKAMEDEKEKEVSTILLEDPDSDSDSDEGDRGQQWVRKHRDWKSLDKRPHHIVAIQARLTPTAL